MTTSFSRKSRVIIREVWEHNLDSEFSIIKNMVKNYSYVAIDTEYPGIIYHPIVNTKFCVTPISVSHSYSLLKANVDALKIIQLGLTFSDENGNLPHLGTDSCYVWQFNFKEFDIKKDFSNSTSIELLKQQGIDFVKNKQQGISATNFSKWFFWCFGPGRRFYNPTENLNITWISFHGTYDFAYLLSIIMLDKLPYDLNTFAHFLRYYFGTSVYDLKVILKFQGLHGGLKRMAEILDVDRIAGNHHQAGSDSLLTMQMFTKMKKKYFCKENFDKLNYFTYVLFGLNLQTAREVYVPYMMRTPPYYQRFY